MLIYESHASISHIKIALYNPMNIFFGLSLEKTDHVIQKNRTMFQSDDIRHLIWYSLSGFVSTKWRPRKEQAFKLNFYSVIENKRLLFAEASCGEIKKLVDNSVQTEETRKNTHRNGLRAFAMRNYSDGYKINKPLVYRKILKILQFPSKLQSCVPSS